MYISYIHTFHRRMSRLSRMSRVFHFSRESRRRISDIDRVHLEYIDACVKDPAMRIEYMKQRRLR